MGFPDKDFFFELTQKLQNISFRGKYWFSLLEKCQKHNSISLDKAWNIFIFDQEFDSWSMFEKDSLI